MLRIGASEPHEEARRMAPRPAGGCGSRSVSTSWFTAVMCGKMHPSELPDTNLENAQNPRYLTPTGVSL
jgi:hypothetical protein